MKRTVRKMYLSGRKKLLTGILTVSMLLACGCSRAEEVKNEENGKTSWKKEMSKVQAAENESREVLVYIREYDGKKMVFDEVEWIDIPSDRADELGLEDEGSGFVVYNETDEELEECLIADDCKCTVLDWTENYASVEVTPEKLAELLDERDAPYIPYILTIVDRRILSVQERYVP